MVTRRKGISRPSTSQARVNSLPFDRRPFTDLLKMPPIQHKVSTIKKNENSEIKCVSHKSKIPFDERCGGALKRLGLYHVCKMGHTTLRDKSLIRALVERWRPETHTFHMPVGEMTITLQDVSCLLGLPISGTPVTGISDKDWTSTIENCLGVAVSDDAWRSRAKTRDGVTMRVPSGYSLRLQWLRTKCGTMPEHPTSDQVDHYTRAYILDFFGSVLFPTSNGDDVPAMYLQLLQNLSNPPSYNWGGAVLAYLYRALSIAAQANRHTIAACMELLQLWSWTRFAACRPKQSRHGIEFSDWGVPNLKECQPYGKKWTGPKLWDNPHNCGSSHARDVLDKLDDDHGITWVAYDDVLDRLPLITQHDRKLWLARVPLIHFWIVAFHYPDRVMRQFGYRQSVPVPPPLDWVEELKLQHVEHTSQGLGHDWGIHWVDHVQAASQPLLYLVHIDGPHDQHWYSSEYMQWYETHGMRTVFLEHYHDSDVRQRRSPSQPPSSETYLSQSDVYARIAMRSYRAAVIATKQVITNGMKKFGKSMLLLCRDNMDDVGQLSRFNKLLKDAGLPEVVEDIPIDDDEPVVYDGTDARWVAAYKGTLSYEDLWNPPQVNGTQAPLMPSTSQHKENEQSSQACMLTLAISSAGGGGGDGDSDGGDNGGGGGGDDDDDNDGGGDGDGDDTCITHRKPK